MGNCCPQLVGGGAESNVVAEVTKNNGVERGEESNVVAEVTKNNDMEREPVKISLSPLPFPTTKPQNGNSVIPAEDKHPDNSVIPVKDEHPEMKKCTNGHVLEDSTPSTFWICSGCNCAHDTKDGRTLRLMTRYMSKYLVWDLPSDAKRYRCQTCDYDLCEICYKAKGKTHRDGSAYCMLRPVAIPVTKQILLGMDVYSDEDWNCKRCKRRPDMDTKIFWKCYMCSYRMCNKCLEVD